MRFPQGSAEMSEVDRSRVEKVLARCSEKEIQEGRKLWAFDNWTRQADERKTVSWFNWILEQIDAADEYAYEIQNDL